MKKLAIVFAFILFVAAMAHSQTMSTIGKGTPLNVQNEGFTDFIKPATSTFSIKDTATLVGTLPAGTTALWIISASGTVAFGDASLATATVANYPLIANGSFRRFSIYPNEKNPTIYMLNGTAGATSTVSIMAEVQR
jgi:hypothetical protein